MVVVLTLVEVVAERTLAAVKLAQLNTVRVTHVVRPRVREMHVVRPPVQSMLLAMRQPAVGMRVAWPAAGVMHVVKTPVLQQRAAMMLARLRRVELMHVVEMHAALTFAQLMAAWPTHAQSISPGCHFEPTWRHRECVFNQAQTRRKR